MLQNTRNRLVAPGFAAPAGLDQLEALMFEPWTDLTADVDRRLVSAVVRADGAAPRTTDPVSTWVPAVDVEERPDAIRLAFEVPGVDPNALDVTVDGRVLTIRGERTLTRPAGEAERSAYRLERRYGRFARSFTLPTTVDPTHIQAHYEYGVLHLELPKRPEAQPRRIAVATGAATAGAATAGTAGGQRQLDAGAA